MAEKCANIVFLPINQIKIFTMIAREQLNRKHRIMELNPKYADIILARCEKLC